MRRLRGISLVLSLVPLGMATGAAAQSGASSIGGLVLRPTSIPPLVEPPPPVAEEATPGRVVRVQPEPAIVTTADDATTAAIPRRLPAGDPYEPLGIRSGGLVLYPSLTVGFGHTTNAAGAAGGTASAYAVLSPELLMRSDWSLHEATFAFRGSFHHYFDDVTADRPELVAVAGARLDLSDGWRVPIGASYRFTTQSPSSADFPLGVDEPPGVNEFKGSVGATRDGLLGLQGELSADRTEYDNGTSGGVPVDQSDRTNTVFAGRLRTGYSLSPAFAPFVEAELARRQFERAVDAGGVPRSGQIQYYRGGIAFDGGPILIGEVKFGYGVATFDDPALATIRAFTADGNLVWSPTILTRATLIATTTIDPSTDSSSSGSVVYQAGLDVAYSWRSNLTVNAIGSVRQERIQGTGEIDTDTRAGLAATWRLSRTLSLTAGYAHDWFETNIGVRDFESDAVRMEVRAQR